MKMQSKYLIYLFIVLGFILLFTNSCKKVDNENSSYIVNDIDGNVYHTVNVGTQVWMVENLKVTKYNNGTAIPLVTDNTAWSNLTTPGYCWYNDSAQTYKNTYGALYNWYAENNGILCPTGWHVPTNFEWTQLTNFLGGDSIAGGKLKEAGTSHWIHQSSVANNFSGFTALPGGFRDTHGIFYDFSIFGYWWSTTGYDASRAWYRSLAYNSAKVNRNYSVESVGFSVRCIRDY
ncbi:MAG: fibrobacter succinogenes major paralogous domain-containing protein [Bacteroidia bacterium]|nr:fibrobacter succinogenes major paralogous domain-containing protein [Bacteroidia bacterium]